MGFVSLFLLLGNALSASAGRAHHSSTNATPASPASHAQPWPPSPSPDLSIFSEAVCTQPSGNCWDSLCCAQPATAPVYGCFKRVDRNFAQCRPKYGWFNHTERLQGVCRDDKNWLCPETWLTDAKPDRPAPQERASLPSSNTVVRSTFWNYECTGDYQDCTHSECCADPSFGCYKRSGRHFAMCRPRQANCVDYEWLCPGWERCAKTHEDCTSSLCCRDASSQCHRRPQFFYAQCRSESLPCTPWDQRHTLIGAAAADGWLCPGWEVCSVDYEECSLSRCCSNPAFSCYLNRTSSERSEWYAQCRPRPVHNHTTPTPDSHHLALTDTAAVDGGVMAGAQGEARASDQAACETASSDWVCPAKWMEWRDALLHEYPIVERHPGGTAAAILVAVGVCCGSFLLCMVCISQRNNMKKAVRAAKAELTEMKIQSEIKRDKEGNQGLTSSQEAAA